MKTMKLIILIFSFFGMIWGFLFTIGGDMTAAPENGFKNITEGININYTADIKQSSDNDIYVLGATCVQRFNKSGDFIKGVYYDSDKMRVIVNYKEYLSLSNKRVIIFDQDDRRVIVLDKELNIIEEISVNKDYEKENFYLEFPDTDSSNKNVKLTLFNYVKIGNIKIKLDAYRNFFTSRYGAMIILLISVAIMLIAFEVERQ